MRHMEYMRDANLLDYAAEDVEFVEATVELLRMIMPRMRDKSYVKRPSQLIG